MNRTGSRLTLAGIGLAGACAVVCCSAPLLLVLIPSLGLVIGSAVESIEVGLIASLVLVAVSGISFLVWRRRHPQPSPSSRARWWATTALLAACQMGDVVRGPERRQQLSETLGRLGGMATLLLSEPKEPGGPGVSTGAKTSEGVVTRASNA